jgi:hypothetical protein
VSLGGSRGGLAWIVVVVSMASWRSDMRKMRLDPEDSIVIFFFFGFQFVIWEDVM